MKRVVLIAGWLVLGLAALVLASCDLFEGEDERDINIPLGSYEEFGERVLVNDSIVFEGIAGIHFQRTIKFEEDGISIRVVSDCDPEMGIARGSYVTKNNSLIITIKESTSSYYKRREIIRYDDVEVVDGKFRIMFKIGEYESVFKGPGLILTKVMTDENDIDEDGNRNEPKRERYYFSLFIP